MNSDILQAQNTDERVNEAEKFFEVLYGRCPSDCYSYLVAFKPSAGLTTFKIPAGEGDKPAVFKAMADTAVKLNDTGKSMYHPVNVLRTAPANGKRGTENDVDCQCAIVADIDISGDAHKSGSLAADFDEALSFLPTLKPTIIVNSGFGLHAYWCFNEPVKVTADNREELKQRNTQWLNVIRQNAHGKAIDPVGDLPRVLRTPGTKNYKTKDNAPICKIIELNDDCRYSAKDFDDYIRDRLKPDLSALATEQTAKTATEQPVLTEHTPARRQGTLAKREEERVLNMLKFINVAPHEYDKWFAVGCALKNLGFGVDTWEQWSRTQPNFKDGECDYKFETFNREGYGIGTLYKYAVEGGYCEPFVGTADRVQGCPVNLRVPRDYSFSADGIIYWKPPKNEDGKATPCVVARTPLLPCRVYQNPVSHEVTYVFALLVNGQWVSVEVGGDIISDARDLRRELSKHGALISDTARLICFINEFIFTNRDMPYIAAFAQCGWVGDDFKQFASPTDDTIVKRQGFCFEKIFKPKGDKQQWLSMFKRIMKDGGDTARLCMGASCAAMLVRPLNLMNLQIHLHGKRSIGKTPLLRFCVSAFGDSRLNALSYSLGATSPKARLEYHAALSDLPLIGEEIEAMDKRQADNLSQDIYNFSLGIGGQVLKKDGTRRDAKVFSGCRLTSGEHALSSDRANGGELKRVLSVRCSSLLEENFAASLHAFAAKNCGHFLRIWTDYIRDNLQTIERDFHGVQVYCQQNFGGIFDLTQLSTIAASCLAYQHFCKAVGIQDAVDWDSLRGDIDKATEQLQAAAELDDVTRARTFLQDYIAGHDKFFTRETSPSDRAMNNEYTQTAMTCCGKIFKNGEVAFIPSELSKILEDEGKFRSATKLIKEFGDRGWLKTKLGDKTNVTVAWFNGKSRRVYRFAAGILQEHEQATDTQSD